MHARHLLALFLPTLVLAGCATPAQQAARSLSPVYAADLSGKAASCTAPEEKLTDGKPSTVAMATGGGGWCGILVTRDGKPLDAGLLTQRPHNGSVYVHLVGDDTRVDYIPRPGAVGADSFTVKFIPGDETMQVTVNAAPTAATAAPVAAK